MSFSRARNEYEEKFLFLQEKAKNVIWIFRSIFERVEKEKSFANHVLCENVAIRRYKSMIAIKSRDVIKMIKMIVFRDD